MKTDKGQTVSEMFHKIRGQCVLLCKLSSSMVLPSSGEKVPYKPKTKTKPVPNCKVSSVEQNCGKPTR